MTTNNSELLPIKVLMVVDNAGHTTEVFIRNEIKFLSEQIDTLHVLSGPIKNIEYDSVQNHVLEHLLEHSPVPIGIPSILLALPSLAAQVLRYPGLARFAIRNLTTPRETLINLFRYGPIADKLNTEYDIVHIQFAHMLYDVQNLRQAGVIHARKLACSFRGHDISKRHLVHRLKRYISSKESIDLYLPVSELFRKELISMGACPESVITKYSPIDVEGINPAILDENKFHNEEAINIVTCGRLIETKGFDLLIAAAATLRDRHNIKIWIIGDGPNRDQINDQIARLNLTSMVTLLGALPHEEVLKRISSAAVFILCSRRAEDGDREGIPNVLKEAMALRTLTVASDHSGIPELIENNETGFLFSEDSVQSLIDCLENVLSMPRQEKDRITRSAQEYVTAKFSMLTCGNVQLAAYRGALTN
ncbi:Glycosyltransferase involved in cell wall bisynthesis [Neorhodopirellula lusitana]|uniref:Glycosyltransferase involved in cell wall bisynthesis n=1 Tax=Neorhodopirellula lusitana TaxID=445327 RepID=A0ABY1Q9B3_9BACT|nr:glycosyltransferase [Neorhodopirellula lusitana]SMP62065.1 Glycosyltransferase involved in cell wall bisynthesis [Neorhodopirellula lusitana]